jgi:predicted PolB exonuclease-like 3'-5' exonuclease
MDGSQVWSAFQGGQLEEIRAYCETDVVNTYLLYLRFQLMRGALTAEEHAREVAVVRTSLTQAKEPHWAQYMAAWGAASTQAG